MDDRFLLRDQAGNRRGLLDQRLIQVYPGLEAQAYAEQRLYQGWMVGAGYCAAWRGAVAKEVGDFDLMDRELQAAVALKPYPWARFWNVEVA